MMKIIRVKDQVAGGKAGFKVFADALAQGAQVFGLATGSTPISVYDEITNSDLDLSEKTSINLDEYKGLAADHPQSYHYFMNEHLFSKKPFKASYVPDGLAPAASETKCYDQIIADNPINLQLLGLGQNGHIGFNEPGTAFSTQTHEVSLTESTIQANARFFANEAEVPHFAYSMGIASIMQAQQILIMAYGAAKADAVAAMIEGPVTEAVPASALQNHPDVIVIIDDAAASKLKNN
ncbi:glucosamine-6-phosphate deaminase [Weissella oryzae SG25]|uniref:Glucosamine-6-phosphate deaminase n=2 Tax=Weissella TaxID=46255 RepID=A0A069CTG6_WEIOS|nr:glucosamine-6-phosphate deaminase [Weissella oryzae SG25]